MLLGAYIGLSNLRGLFLFAAILIFTGVNHG